MKKSKLVGLLAIALTFGMVACGGGGGGGDEPQECSHEYEAYAGDTDHVVKAATCTEKGVEFQKCKLCGDIKEKSVRANGHKYEDIAGGTAATCTEAGSKLQKCSVCQDQKTVTVDALGHDMVKDTSKTDVDPTCDTAGTKFLKCSRCTEVEEQTVAALGHTFTKDENDEDVVTWTSQATCEAGGVGKKHCETCKKDVDYTTEALGHKYETTDTAVPAAGKAAVRIYTCVNGCAKTQLGFKASEVSDESKKHLVIGEDGGARFWGRPIGNDVVLDESTGDPSEDSHEAVFNENQPGDYFEYVFDLTAEQAAKLTNCKLYCEATAAQWMSNNSMDFWACKSGDTDWTRGMYVETTETHEKGTDIDTYRYILYVDDVVQDFDPTVSVPAKSNSVKTEYVLPYTFHLHAGTNKIRLVMAGGYRSTFYNFIFRAVEEEGGGTQGGGDPYGNFTKANATKNTLENGDVTYTWGAKAPESKQNWADEEGKDFIKSSVGNNGSSTSAPEDSKRAFVVYYLDVEKASDKNVLSFEVNRNSSSAVTWFGTASNDNSKYYEEDPLNPGTYVRPTYRWIVKINDVEVPFTADGGNQTTKVKMWVDFTIANFALKEGTNKIYVETTGGYSLEIYNWKITQKAPVKITLALNNADAAGKHDDATKWNDKSGANTTATWNVAIPAGNYEVKIVAKMTSSGHTSRYFFNHALNGKEDNGNPADATTEDPFRYFLKLGSTVVNPDTQKTWGELGLSNTAFNECEFISNLVVPEGTTSIQMLHGNIGYSLFVQSIILIKK